MFSLRDHRKIHITDFELFASAQEFSDDFKPVPEIAMERRSRAN
jgi:hypothetical protein